MEKVKISVFLHISGQPEVAYHPWGYFRTKQLLTAHCLLLTAPAWPRPPLQHQPLTFAQYLPRLRAGDERLV